MLATSPQPSLGTARLGPGAGAEAERTLVLESAEPLADGVIGLTFRDTTGAELTPWRPGAHLDLVLEPDGPGRPALVRQYSLCGDPADRTRYQVAVLREPSSRGGSAYIHEQLTPGATVRVGGPRNHFSMVDSPRYLFIAGGIGITPIMPMLAAAEAAGADWRLLYGGRSIGSMAFVADLQRHGRRIEVSPQDEVGLLDLDSALGMPNADTAVYCCGPEPLLAAVEARCAGWPAGSLHLERFRALETDARARPAGEFEVELQQSGLTVRVPADRTILDAVEQAGVYGASSCREGTCGSCETAVLAGEPDHRDSLLSDEEQASGTTMLICVSRARGPKLVLDL